MLNKSLVDNYSDKLSELPEKLLTYTRLERSRIIHSETYTFMSTKMEDD